MAKRITNRLRQESEADESDQDTEAENESTEAEDEDESTEAEGRAEDDDDEDMEDEDMEDDDDDGASASAIAKGRRMERKRIGAILDSKAAQGGRQKQARYLAFQTGMAATDAIAVLREAPTGASGRSFSERADRAGSPKLSPGGDVKNDGASEEAATSRITAAARRMSGDGRYRRPAS